MPAWGFTNIQELIQQSNIYLNLYHRISVQMILCHFKNKAYQVNQMFWKILMCVIMYSIYKYVCSSAYMHSVEYTSFKL